MIPFSYSQHVLHNKKKQTTDPWNNLDESQGNYAKWKTPIFKRLHNIWFHLNSIYRTTKLQRVTVGGWQGLEEAVRDPSNEELDPDWDGQMNLYIRWNCIEPSTCSASGCWQPPRTSFVLCSLQSTRSSTGDRCMRTAGHFPLHGQKPFLGITGGRGQLIPYL